jgi:hypothetical protein
MPQNRTSVNFMVIESGQGRWDGRKQSTHQAASGKVMPIRGRKKVYITLVVVVGDIKTVEAAGRTSASRTNPVHIGLWFRQQPARW